MVELSFVSSIMMFISWGHWVTDQQSTEDAKHFLMSDTQIPKPARALLIEVQYGYGCRMVCIYDDGI